MCGSLSYNIQLELKHWQLLVLQHNSNMSLVFLASAPSVEDIWSYMNKTKSIKHECPACLVQQWLQHRISNVPPGFPPAPYRYTHLIDDHNPEFAVV